MNDATSLIPNVDNVTDVNYPNSSENTTNLPDLTKDESAPDNEEESKQQSPYCEVCSFSVWTLMGGIFAGVVLTVVTQLFVKAYRAKKNSSYNDPYSFDNFVNP